MSCWRATVFLFLERLQCYNYVVRLDVQCHTGFDINLFSKYHNLCHTSLSVWFVHSWRWGPKCRGKDTLSAFKLKQRLGDDLVIKVCLLMAA